MLPYICENVVCTLGKSVVHFLFSLAQAVRPRLFKPPPLSPLAAFYRHIRRRRRRRRKARLLKWRGGKKKKKKKRPRPPLFSTVLFLKEIFLAFIIHGKSKELKLRAKNVRFIKGCKEHYKITDCWKKGPLCPCMPVCPLLGSCRPPVYCAPFPTHIFCSVVLRCGRGGCTVRTVLSGREFVSLPLNAWEKRGSFFWERRRRRGSFLLTTPKWALLKKVGGRMRMGQFSLGGRGKKREA